MKKLTAIALLCLLALQLTAVEWGTDLSKALDKAKVERRLVFIDFTGSDWCPPCKALHKNVLTSPEFEDYAKTNLVLVIADFPQAKEQTEELKKANKALAEKYSIEGYPTVIVLDGDGKIVYKNVGYSGESPKEFIGTISDKIKAQPKS